MYKKTLIQINKEKFVIARKKAGLTQTDLAQLTGLCQEYISYIETGKKKGLRKSTHEKISKIISI